MFRLEKIKDYFYLIFQFIMKKSKISNIFQKHIATRVFNLIAKVNKQLIAYFGQIQLIAIL